MKKKMVVIGGGGHAKVVLDLICSTGLYEIKGILDPELKTGDTVLSYRVLGGDEFLKKQHGTFNLAIGIGSTRATDKRRTVYEQYKDKFEFPLLIHPCAVVSKGARISKGVQIMAGAIVRPDANVGENVIINTGAIVEHDCEIGAHSNVSLGAIVAGGCRIGKCSYIGMGSSVLQGIKIGDFVTVGAGAVVTKDIPDRKTVIGVPAKAMHE